jgi:hypothetical protein
MTLTAERRQAPPVPRRRRRLGIVGLVVALAAAGTLLLTAPRHGKPAAPGRLPAPAAWPKAQRADIPGNLPDGPVFSPAFFLDARTAIGTAPSPDARSMRLLIRGADGTLRELRRLPLDRNPQFDNVTAAGGEVVWTESTDRGKLQVWAAGLRGRPPPRRLTADTGNAVFFGSQYDLTVAGGRVYWAAAPDGAKTTEIRSLPLTGGAVQVRVEPGTWALSAWPWLTDGAGGQAGTTKLHNMATNRDVEINSTGVELTTCSPVWCRVMVMNGGGLARIDVMHPDGSARSRIAGGAARAAIQDVAVLDRFEVLSEPGPDSDLTGTEGLLVYDISRRRTVDISAAVSAAFSRGGVLWWSTGDQDSIVWHTVDLRTV